VRCCGVGQFRTQWSSAIPGATLRLPLKNLRWYGGVFPNTLHRERWVDLAREWLCACSSNLLYLNVQLINRMGAANLVLPLWLVGLAIGACIRVFVLAFDRRARGAQRR
jgi:hypothetical protein